VWHLFLRILLNSIFVSSHLIMSISSISNEIFTHLYECAELFGSLELLKSIEFGAESLKVKGREDSCCWNEEPCQIESKSNCTKSANQSPPHYITSSRPIITTPSPSTKSIPSLPELPGQNWHHKSCSAYSTVQYEKLQKLAKRSFELARRTL